LGRAVTPKGSAAQALPLMTAVKPEPPPPPLSLLPHPTETSRIQTA
jgi:hypothetical protein